LAQYDTPFRSSVSLAMSFISLISFICTFTVLYFIWRNELYRKRHTRIIMYLCISDLVQSFATLLSFLWATEVPDFGEPGCIVQGVILQIGDVASSIASAVICTYVFATVYADNWKWIKTPGIIFERVGASLIYGVSILFACIGWMRYAATGVPFYTPVGFRSWCWINEAYPVDRMMLHYAWIFLICFYMFCLYILLGRYLHTHSKNAPNEREVKKKKKIDLQSDWISDCVFYCFCSYRIRSPCDCH